MKSGVFRHLPIIENGEVKACISLRDIAQQVSSGLSKKPMTSPPTVAELMDAKGSGGCIELPASSMVADAVKLMQQTKAGSVLVSSGASSFGLFTERDFLTKVAVYDEVAPSALPISLVSTPSDVVKCVAPTARVTDCLSIMLAGGFRHLPVIDNKQPVGMISMRDILNFCARVHMPPPALTPVRTSPACRISCVRSPRTQVSSSRPCVVAAV